MLAMKNWKKLGTPKGEVGSFQFDRDRVGDVCDCDGVRVRDRPKSMVVPLVGKVMTEGEEWGEVVR